ncbi:hypothetical protein F4824DRAFT_496500 [Ustulina deusta]|nr:hypothetical protein F4824DRAFT_496500 [Ustulina deusta]
MDSSSRSRARQKTRETSLFRNTAVWIPDLEPEMDYHTLLAAIRDIGRVKCAEIHRYPELDPPHSAASITFFSHDAAQKLVNQARDGKFFVLDKGRRVSWRNRYVGEESGHNDHSRVLRIEGHPYVVNKKALEEFWRQFFRWDTDTVADIGMGAVWYFFASWSQAATAMAMLVNHFDDVLVVAYSIDPCGD